MGRPSSRVCGKRPFFGIRKGKCFYVCADRVGEMLNIKEVRLTLFVLK
jgi:hypothetical protein